MTNISNQSTKQARLTKTKGLILASLIAGAMALPFVIPAQRAHAEDEQGENSQGLLGTWIVQVTLDPHTVPPGTPLTFMALYTFSAGGGYMASNAGPAAGQPAGQGNWVRTGHRKVAATQLRFGVDTAHHFTGINKIRESFTLNEQGDELTGSVQVDVFLPDGTLLPFHPAATYQGTRVPIEPVN